MRVALTDQDDPMTAGFIGSIVFHIFIVLAIIFGVPSFFEPEVLEQPPTIELATLSDITAAPKVQKVSNKIPDKPKEQPAPEKPKPKVETPPPAAAAPPPPPPPEPQAVVIPDPAQKPIEKKPEEKKVDKPKEKEKKAEDKAFEDMLKNLNKSQPAPEPTAKPSKKTPPPAEPTSGPQAALTNDVPLTQSESDGIANQIRPNWNVDVGALPDPREYVAWLRVTFAPNGTVQTVDYLDKGRLSDPRYRSVAESCKRAFFITKQVKFPPGKEQPSIRFGCDPSSL